MPESSQPDRPVVSSSVRERQIEAAMEQYLALLESGAPPDRDEFLARYPAIADELEGQLEAIELLQLTSPQIIAAEDTPTDSEEFADRSQLGDFRLLRPIGRGGMGVVYKAIQLSLDRSVAVKVLPFASLLNSKQRQRFQNEARAAATLEHPNIVPILFTGVERGVHFYAMQLIEGQSLAEVIQSMRVLEVQLDKPTRRLPIGEVASKKKIDLESSPDAETQPDLHQETDSRGLANVASSTLKSHVPLEFYRSVAQLGAQAAEALQYAHEHGVVHRDVKPGNLMLDEAGKLWITDFGLARHERNDTITMEGDVFGTIAYMSPEQRSGSQLADARSDVYSLGATLYEVLSLTQPFSDQKDSDFARWSHLEPTPLRNLIHGLPIDLATIIQKSMASQSQDRYQTAGEFAEDLKRFCDGQTIQARPPTTMDRFMKWTLRHRSIAAGGVLAITAIGIVFAIATIMILRAQRVTQQALSESEHRADQYADLLYISDMQLAYRAWNSNRPEQAREVLDQQRPRAGEIDRRGVEWQLLDSLTRQPQEIIVGSHGGAVNQIAVFPDGGRVASVGADNMLRLWDLRTGSSFAAISLGDTSIEMPFSVAVSPDGTTIATGSDTVLLWDADSGKLIKELTSFDYNVESIAYSPDGALIACGSRYDRVRIFDAEGELVREIEDTSRHESLTFTPDGKQLIVPSRRTIPGVPEKVGFIKVWETDSFRDSQDFWTGNRDSLNNLTLATCSSNGDFAVACELHASRPVMVFEPDSGKVLLELKQSRDAVNAVVVSPDSARLAVAYSDGTVGYWNLMKDDSGRLVPPYCQHVLVAHRGKVQSIQFVDDDRLVSCGVDGQIRLWTLPKLENPKFRTDRNLHSRSIAIGPKGRSILYLNAHHRLCMMNPTGVVQSDHAVRPMVDRLVCSVDFSMVALWSYRQTGVEVRSIPSGDVIQQIDTSKNPSWLSFSPNNRQLAILDERGDLMVWDLQAKRFVARCPVDLSADGQSYLVEYSRDGKQLLCTSEARGIDVLETTDFQRIRHVTLSSNTLSVSFSSDGSLLATAHDDGVVRLWSWPHLELHGELTGHETPVDDLCFYGNDRLLSIGRDGTLRIWSPAARRSLGIIEHIDNEGACVSASENGRLVCAGLKRSPHSLLVFRVDE